MILSEPASPLGLGEAVSSGSRLGRAGKSPKSVLLTAHCLQHLSPMHHLERAEILLLPLFLSSLLFSPPLPSVGWGFPRSPPVAAGGRALCVCAMFCFASGGKISRASPGYSVGCGALIRISINDLRNG